MSEQMDDEDDREESTDGIIICDERTGLVTNFILGIVLAAIAIPISRAISFDDPRDYGFVYCIRGIFPAIGLLIWVTTLWKYFRSRKYGVSSFQVDNKTGRLGDKLSGTIKTSVEVIPKNEFIISLECIETKVSSGTNDSSRTSYVTRWKDEVKIGARTASSQTGLPVSFTVPANMPPSNNLGGDGQIRWIVRAYAATRGLNYKAAFVVPVLPRN